MELYNLSENHSGRVLTDTKPTYSAIWVESFALAFGIRNI
jgi:hypothetical protein